MREKTLMVLVSRAGLPGLSLQPAKSPDSLLDLKAEGFGSSRCGSVVMTLISIHEDAGLIPGLAKWVKDLGCRCGFGSGVARIWPLAWELAYAVGLVLKRQKKKKSKSRGLWFPETKLESVGCSQRAGNPLAAIREHAHSKGLETQAFHELM